MAVGGIHLLRESGIIYEDSLTDLGLNVSTDYIEFEVTKEGSTAFGHVTFPGGAASGNINGPGLPPQLVGSGSIALNNGTSLQIPQDQIIVYNEDGTLGTVNGIVDTILNIANSVAGPGGSGQVFAGYAFIGATGDIAGFSVAGTRLARSLYSIGRSLEERGLIYINGFDLSSSFDDISISSGSGLFGFRGLSFTAIPSGTAMNDEFGTSFTSIDKVNFDDGAGGNTVMDDEFYKADLLYLKNDGALGYARARGEYAKLSELIADDNSINARIPNAYQSFTTPLYALIIQEDKGIVDTVDLRTIAGIFEAGKLNTQSVYIDNQQIDSDEIELLGASGIDLTIVGTSGIQIGIGDFVQSTSGSFPSGTIYTDHLGSGWTLQVNNSGVVTTCGPFAV